MEINKKKYTVSELLRVHTHTFLRRWKNPRCTKMLAISTVKYTEATVAVVWIALNRVPGRGMVAYSAAATAPKARAHVRRIRWNELSHSAM